MGVTIALPARIGENWRFFAILIMDRWLTGEQNRII